MKQKTVTLNSGKTNIQIVSDDHLTFRISDKGIDAITPIWDAVSMQGNGKKVHARNIKIFFLEDDCNKIERLDDIISKIHFTVKHSILFAFSHRVTEKIMVIAEMLSTNFEMFKCPVGNSSLILKFIDDTVACPV